MPIKRIRIKVGKGVEKEVSKILGVAKVYKREIILRSFHGSRIMYERMILAQVAKEATSKLYNRITTIRRMNKLGKTKWGRAYINNLAINLAKKYGKETLEISESGKIETNYKVFLFRKELKKLLNNHKLKGKQYVDKVRRLIYKYFDKDVAKKIDRKLLAHLVFSTVGKNGVLDISGKVFYGSNESLSFKQLDKGELHKAQNLIKLSKFQRLKEYFEFKESEILLKVLEEYDDPKLAALKYEEEFRRLLKEDTKFRIAAEQYMTREIVKTYNIAGMIGVLQETLTTIPTRLVSMTSRMLARIYSMLPIVGSAAATSAETAGALAELGEALSQKISSSGYTWFNLRDALGPLADQITPIMKEQTKIQT